MAVGLNFGLPIYQQQAVVQEIERLGGSFYADPRGPKWLRDRVGDERMLLIENVDEVYLCLTDATDATLGQIGKLPMLQNLNLSHTQVTDAGLAHLQGLTNLEMLELNNTAVTDMGLERLKGLTKLKWLSLRNTQVTDAGIAELQHALPELAIGSSIDIHP